jgi:tetratricopeptide (TPR) repeat protein
VHRFRALSVAAAAALAAACAPPSLAFRQHVGKLLEDRQYDAAAQAIDEAREPKYGDRDRVLYWLDKGAVLHAARDYAGSDRLLDQAELRIEELYTKSLSQAAGTVLVNDATQDYAGEPHERALLYVVRALNYAYQGRVDDAVVEARKVTAFLEQQGERVAMKSYREDAFAHLLSAMLFEDAGRHDDARISRAAAERAYARYGRDFGVSTPRFGLAPRAPTEGELVLLHYNGKAPLRGTKHTSVPVGRKRTVREMASSGSDEEFAQLPVAIPTIVEQPYDIRGSVVEVASRSAATVAVEPIAAITARTLEDEMPAIKARASARVAAKGGAYAAADAAGASKVLTGAGLSAAGAFEEADTRGWAVLPAEIRMARVVLPEGVHDVHVRYLDASGAQWAEETLSGVEIVRGYRTYVHVQTAR